MEAALSDAHIVDEKIKRIYEKPEYFSPEEEYRIAFGINEFLPIFHGILNSVIVPSNKAVVDCIIDWGSLEKAR